MKQRVAIARAILRAAPILLLDEATSALDSKNERIVQAALDDLVRKQVTGCVISIAHRLTTIRNCNKIVVIKDGYKLEEGARPSLPPLFPLPTVASAEPGACDDQVHTSRC